MNQPRLPNAKFGLCNNKVRDYFLGSDLNFHGHKAFS